MFTVANITFCYCIEAWFFAFMDCLPQVSKQSFWLLQIRVSLDDLGAVVQTPVNAKLGLKSNRGS